MDINLIRTFLDIVQSGSFSRSAERLYVTQTTVTARVRQLEQSLGSVLFIRNRSGASLTAEGENFQKHANDILNSWNHAKRSISLPVGHLSRLLIGSESSLWNPLMVNWMAWLQSEMPSIAVTSHVLAPSNIIAALKRGQLDAALVHLPSYGNGLKVEQLLEEKLIHVRSPISMQPDIFVDWGEEFERQYNTVASSRAQCGYSFDLGPAALQFMLQVGGNGWFRTRVVQPYLETGRLLSVAGSAEFTYPVYLLYRSDPTKPALNQALIGLRDAATLNSQWLL